MDLNQPVCSQAVVHLTCVQTFHLTCVHIIFSSVSVAEWPPFWK